MIKLAIVGSRDYDNYDFLTKEVEKFIEKYGEIDTIISGGANGVDKFAEKYAKKIDIPIIVYKADWNKHGKKAGPLRNIQIVEESTHILAFPSRKGKGTQHTINTGKKMGKVVEVIYID